MTKLNFLIILVFLKKYMYLKSSSFYDKNKINKKYLLTNQLLQSR